jgi:hypothetical protein
LDDIGVRMETNSRKSLSRLAVWSPVSKSSAYNQKENFQTIPI